MGLSIQEMKDELIRLAYERRDKTYDIVLTKEEKKQRLEELYEERKYIEVIQASEIQDITKSFKWQKVQAEIEGIEIGCTDPYLCRKLLEYKIASMENIELKYVQKMANGEIEFDEDVLRHFIINAINEDFIIGNKEFLFKAIETTGESLLLATVTSEDTIKDILTDAEFMKKILGKDEEKSANYLSGEEELEVITSQLERCESLNNNDWIRIIDNALKLNNDYVCYCIAYSLLDQYWNDEEGILINKVFDLLEVCSPYELDDNRDYFNNINTISDEKLAYRYCKIFENTDCVSDELLEDREFLERILDGIIMSRVNLPEKFKSDADILEKYFMHIELPNLNGISIETLNNERVEKAIKKAYGVDPNTLFLNDIAERLEKTGTIVTHYGDDLDNKAAIEAIQRWGEDNDYIRIGHTLKALRVPAGQIKEGMLNVDTGGHKGSCIKNGQDSDTIIIDGDPEHRVKSASEALSRLGIYVPEQIVELADTKPNKVSSLDSRSGLALVRYLNGEQTFKLAEARLLDKSLSDEQLEEYGLTEAHQKQQEIIDNAVAKIEKYTEELPNGEKIVLAPEQILAGSSIAYEMGINYYVSTSQHFDSESIPDGVTFAITCKPGIELPEAVLEYGKKLSETYKTGENSSNVFVHPNNQMIVAGGIKNPDFRIPGESRYGILNKIYEMFQGKEKSIE